MLCFVQLIKLTLWGFPLHAATAQARTPLARTRCLLGASTGTTTTSTSSTACTAALPATQADRRAARSRSVARIGSAECCALRRAAEWRVPLEPGVLYRYLEGRHGAQRQRIGRGSPVQGQTQPIMLSTCTARGSRTTAVAAISPHAAAASAHARHAWSSGARQLAPAANWPRVRSS